MFSSFSNVYTVRSLLQNLSTSLARCRHMNGGAACRTFSNGKDIELSYTAYPDLEHTVDPKKTPLLFAHGLFGAKGNLHSVSKHLSNDGRKVITYDARNHGDSDHSSEFNFLCLADDLSDLIEDLGLSEPFVMGHSMGGKTAMTLALTKPEKLKALVVADIAPGKSPGVGKLLDYAKAMKSVEIPKDATLSFARRQAKLQLSKHVPNEMILNFLLTNLKVADDGQIMWRVNFDPFINNFHVIQDFPVAEGSTFSKPTLFVFGENSDHYRSEGMDKIKTFFPESEIVAIKDAGHFVHADKPIEFVRVVQDFCDGVEA
ncbi:hypothetical protein EGW08_006529 [Elysia chlorotica]|uniref:sn-1-specific diacylglycerol lipase ABHD11 n=1 Tax=Elysia chlorotica TaxID=188477 RepID=A0A3S1BDE0_ELYCH|nr:hypothetical protein EGW08_006529 [Elysia chlorotica]